MIRNYIALAWRNLRRQPGFSIINILGLSIGLACTIVIMLYVQHELSYDRFHEKGDRIYRITADAGDVSIAIAPAPLAILISCLGLYGLSAFVTEQRTREIGIRKVLGASVPNIVRLLSLKFMLPIVAAMAIAAPITFYLMNGWLDGLAYRIAFGWNVFVMAGLLALAIGLLTISVECIKAARVNPVKSLRSE